MREDTYTNDAASAAAYDRMTFPQPGSPRPQPTTPVPVCDDCAAGNHKSHERGRCNPSGYTHGDRRYYVCSCDVDAEDMLECNSCGEVREDVGACEHDEPVCDDCSPGWCAPCTREAAELEQAEAAMEMAREWDGGLL